MLSSLINEGGVMRGKLSGRSGDSASLLVRSGGGGTHWIIFCGAIAGFVDAAMASQRSRSCSLLVRRDVWASAGRVRVIVCGLITVVTGTACRQSDD